MITASRLPIWMGLETFLFLVAITASAIGSTMWRELATNRSNLDLLTIAYTLAKKCFSGLIANVPFNF